MILILPSTFFLLLLFSVFSVCGSGCYIRLEFICSGERFTLTNSGEFWNSFSSIFESPLWMSWDFLLEGLTITVFLLWWCGFMLYVVWEVSASYSCIALRDSLFSCPCSLFISVQSWGDYYMLIDLLPTLTLTDFLFGIFYKTSSSFIGVLVETD